MASYQDVPPKRGQQIEDPDMYAEETEMERRMRLRKEAKSHAEEVTGKFRSYKDLNASAPFDRSLLDVDLGKPEDEQELELAPPTGTIVTSNNTFTFKSDGEVQGQRKVTVPYVQGHFPFYPAKGGEPLQVTGYMPVNSFQGTKDDDPFSYELKGSDQANEVLEGQRNDAGNLKRSRQEAALDADGKEVKRQAGETDDLNAETDKNFVSYIWQKKFCKEILEVCQILSPLLQNNSKTQIPIANVTGNTLQKPSAADVIASIFDRLGL